MPGSAQFSVFPVLCIAGILSGGTGDRDRGHTQPRLTCYVLDKLLRDWDEGEVSFLIALVSDVYFFQCRSLIANG